MRSKERNIINQEATEEAIKDHAWHRFERFAVLSDASDLYLTELSSGDLSIGQLRLLAHLAKYSAFKDCESVGLKDIAMQHINRPSSSRNAISPEGLI